ncbi:MAG: hypothetical protein J1F24_02070 [Oscillospiraceae bacterium]|nr:hypothetical protein [Oscillospiraceae bacterium]
MRSKILNEKKISPSCSYCAHGKSSPDGESVLCIKKGVMEKDGYCKKFNYDILKRQPKRPRSLGKFNEDDFSL